MRRETMRWVKDALEDNEGFPEGSNTRALSDILDSDKKQRARIRDLEARLKLLAGAADDDEVDAALDLRNKSWRKGGGK